MKIKNVKGSDKVSKLPSKYSSWLEYWEMNHGFIIKETQLYSCPACKNAFLRKNFDGCHVQKVLSKDKKWYIIPLCDSCNHRMDSFDVDKRLLVDVPSNLKI